MKTEKNILIAFILNIAFAIFEFIGGIITGSIAITSDAVHDIGDAFSIGISYLLEKKSKIKPDKYHTYGYIRYSVIGSIITTAILLIGSSFVVFEAIKRLINPVDINYNGMIIFAVIGVIVNIIASIVTKDGDSLNQKSVNLHMLEDVLGWIVVLIGSILMKYTNINVIDSILSILVALFILFSSFKTLKIIIDVFLETTPKNIDIDKIRNSLKTIDGVCDVHHIHVRSIDGISNFATLHVACREYNKEIKDLVRHKLEEYGIVHSTIELELEDEDCTNLNCEMNFHHEHHHHHH